MGIDTALNVENGIIFKISNEVTDDVHFLEGPQGLIISGCLLVQVRQKGKLKVRRGFLAWSVNLYKAVESNIPHLCQSQGCTFSIFQIRLLPGEQTKKSSFPDLREPYQTEFHAIFLLLANKTLLAACYP
jgi:hypothetical protein